MTHVPNREPSSLFRFAAFSMIENKTINSSTVHDAYGIVVRVGNITRPDFVPQASENTILSQFLEFEIKNSCGYTCELFVQLWRELGLELGYHWNFGMNPTICVLRFWNVDDHEGRQCLISHNGASKITFNQSYPEINMDRVRTQFLQRMQTPELDEVVDED
uniref:Uncharacterized protein n=1 Tax=Arabidopsis thaliana TaxID=3702 RepID=Q9ZUG1_ARATH|nr:hypothetical protein [Arabidopsis thaliana]